MPYKNSSGKQCVVVGCTNNQKKLYDWQKSDCEIHEGQKHEDCPCLQIYKMHCIPKKEDTRRLWLKAINRKDFNPTTETVVCSIHFINGRPNKENPVPVLHMGYTAKEPTPVRRPLVRRTLSLNTPIKSEGALETPLKSKHIKLEEETPLKTEEKLIGELEHEFLVATPVQYIESMEIEQPQCDSACCFKYPHLCNNYKRPQLVDTSTQTIDLVALDHNYFYSNRTRDASTQHSSAEFSVDSIVTDTDSKFYTGLSLTVFMTLISTLSKFGKELKFRLSIPNQILLVLVRLRLALTFSDIGRRFNISHQLVSIIFNTWIDIMAEQLSSLIAWLPRDTIRRTLPSSFITSYPRTTTVRKYSFKDRFR